MAWLTPEERKRFGLADLIETTVVNIPGLRSRIDLPWDGCSTCQREMDEYGTPDAKRKGTWRTKGHFRPRMGIGLPDADDLHHKRNKPTTGRRLWAWQCYRCNHEQGRYTLRQWRYWLEDRPTDSRLALVVEMIEHLRSLGIPDNDF